MTQESTELRWPVRERDPLMRALRWAALSLMILAVVSYWGQAFGGTQLGSFLYEATGNVFVLTAIMLIASQLSLALVILLAPPGERKASNLLVAAMLLLMPLIGIIPQLWGQYMHTYQPRDEGHALSFASNACLLLLLLSSGTGIAFSKKWAVLPIWAGILFVVSLFVYGLFIGRGSSDWFSFSSETRVVKESVTIRNRYPVMVTVVVQYLQPCPYVLALFFIALIHTMRDRVIAWWLRRRRAGVSVDVRIQRLPR